MKTSNKKAAEYVKQKLEFTGSNTFGNWWKDSYVVYSYGIHYPLYVYKNGSWFENETKYSTTTSKHKTQLRPTFETYKRTTQELIDLITK